MVINPTPARIHIAAASSYTHCLSNDNEMTTTPKIIIMHSQSHIHMLLTRTVYDIFHVLPLQMPLANVGT